MNSNSWLALFTALAELLELELQDNKRDEVLHAFIKAAFNVACYLNEVRELANSSRNENRLYYE